MLTTSSFRDPAGFCCNFHDRILRVIEPGSVPFTTEFLASAYARGFLAKQSLVDSTILTSAVVDELCRDALFQQCINGRQVGMVVEHERIAFPSYPYEWSPEMLHAAGLLTLDLAKEAIQHGYGLKDANPYNVLFRGSQPVFIDLSSFEKREPSDTIWRPYAQFVRTFLLPLLVSRDMGIRLADIFTTRWDGLNPQHVYRLCGPWRRLRPPFLSLVTIPTWLAKRKKTHDPSCYQQKPLGDPDQARFILEHLFHRLRRVLEKLAVTGRERSVWTEYADCNSYSEADFLAKQRFIQGVMAEFRPGRVLDIGCNTGHYSLLMAKAGAQVVALDSDPATVGMLWRKATQARANILPLVIDIARPSPNVGWRNSESPSFLDRAHLYFDAVTALAVLHHLLVTERAPLFEILSLFADLTRDVLILEYVAPADPMFQRIARGRDYLYADLNAESFEKACRQFFQIVRFEPLNQGNRRLYLLRKLCASPAA